MSDHRAKPSSVPVLEMKSPAAASEREFDDGETEATPHRSLVAPSEETFGDPCKLFFRNARPVVLDNDLPVSTSEQNQASGAE